jgi:hypothetical protein
MTKDAVTSFSIAAAAALNVAGMIESGRATSAEEREG